MATLTEQVEAVFRDYVTAGIPATGANDPGKPEVRALLKNIIAAIGAAVQGMVVYADAADLPTDPAPDAGTQARVFDDASAANNGVWVYRDGSWAKDDDFYAQVATAVQPLVDEAESYKDLAQSYAQNASATSLVALRELGVASFTGYPTTPVPDGNAYASLGHYVWDTPQVKSGLVLSVEFSAGQAGTFELGIYTRDGDGLTTRVRYLTITAPGAGVFTIPAVLQKDEGEFVGFRNIGNCVRHTTATPDPSGGWYYGLTEPFTDTTKTTTAPFSLRFEILEVRAIEDLNDRVDEIVGTLYSDKVLTLGEAAPVPATTGGIDQSNFVPELPAPRAGRLKMLHINARTAGNVRVLVWTKTGDDFVSTVEQIVAVESGVGSYAIDLPIAAGQYYGIRAQNVGGLIAGNTALGWYAGIGSNSFTDAAPTRTSRLGIGVELHYTEANVGGDSGSRPASVSLPWATMLILGQGQSLMEGSRTPLNDEVGITLTQEYDTLCYPAYPASPTHLLEATVANSQRAPDRGEWPGLGAARQLRDALARDHNITHETLDNTVAIANNAIGGQRIDQINKGTAPYALALAQAAALGPLTGKSAGVIGVIYGQGETDAVQGTSYATYKGLLKQYAIDIDSDLRAATGQTQRVPTIAFQMCSGGRDIALAQYDAALESDLISIACPMYQLDYYDSRHIDAQSERVLGGYYGEALACWAAGKKWEPLRPIDARVLGNSIILTMNKTGLVIDTTLVPAQAGRGFAVESGGSSITVNSVTVINGNQVRLALASTPTSGALIHYGNEAATGLSPFVGGAGNLRDSAGDIRKIDGLPLHNWCVLFDWAL